MICLANVSFFHANSASTAATANTKINTRSDVLPPKKARRSYVTLSSPVMVLAAVHNFKYNIYT